MKIETLPLSAVIPDPANARLHDDRNLDAIRGSLARFGQQKPIVLDSAGVIRAGNGTYMAAKSLGWETIDVVRTDLAGLDAAAFAIADNRTSDLSAFDDHALGRLLEQLRQEDALEGVGFDLGEIDELLAQLQAETGIGEVEDDGPGTRPRIPSAGWGTCGSLVATGSCAATAPTRGPGEAHGGPEGHAARDRPAVPRRLRRHQPPGRAPRQGRPQGLSGEGTGQQALGRLRGP